MSRKRLAITVMLLAGTVIAFSCLFFKIGLVQTVLYISATLLFFYIIGLIIFEIISKINKSADARARLLESDSDEDDEDDDSEVVRTDGKK